MKTKMPNFSIGIDGEILGCRTRLTIAKEQEDWSYAGNIYIKNGQKSFVDFLPVFFSKETEKSGREYEEFFNSKSSQVEVYHRKDISYLKIQNRTQTIAALSAKEGALILATFQKQNMEVKQGTAHELMQALNQVGELLGADQFVFSLKSGAPPMAYLEELHEPALPHYLREMKEYPVSVYGRFDFRKSNMLFQNVFCQLFGLEMMDFFLTYRKRDRGFICYLMFPVVDNRLFYCEDMRFYVKPEASGMEVGIKGSFLLRLLGDMEFLLDMTISDKRFLLAAHSISGGKFEMIPGFFIQDTALIIGYEKGVTLGGITRLCIRKLELFAGIKFSLYGEIINVSLITAAICKLSLPVLADNILGVHITGIEIFDFIEINSFRLQTKEKYNKNTDVADYINENTVSDEWRLSKENIQICPQNNGIAVLDEKRMCHYFIDNEGKLFLQAQFYYATETCEIGKYQIQKGIFVCGVLTIFGKNIKALFSIKEGEGLIAFAQIDKIELGFLKISASTVSKSIENPILASGNKMLEQFAEPIEDSAVFFLAASNNSCSFYIDGKVELCGLFSVDARIIYRKGLISVDTKFCLYGAVEMYLKLEVSYDNLLDGRVTFCCVIDTQKLEKKLTAVKERIQQAIKRCRESIREATKELDDAKAKVNNLYCEIQTLDVKIEDCRREIQNTSWWKRWLVAIYKGAEILAYEVAKGALYVSIGTAKAVLEVAKAAVQFGGIMGEGILKIAQGVVDASLNLFFLRKIEVAVTADKERQSIAGRIEFVALGKEYKYDTSFSASVFGSNPESEIADNINKKMENDLNNIDKGAFKANRDKYHTREYLKKDRQHLQIGMRELEHATGLLEDVQEIYVEETKELFPEAASLHGGYEQAIAGIENTMIFIAQSIKIEELEQPMQTLAEASIEEEEEALKAQDTLKKYREAQMSYAQIRQNIAQIQEMRKRLESSCEAQKFRSDQWMQMGETAAKDGMENVVNRTEKAMCMKYFRATPKDSGYMNLSKELVIEEEFAVFREKKGYDTPEEIRDIRKKTRSIKYSRRL